MKTIKRRSSRNFTNHLRGTQKKGKGNGTRYKGGSAIAAGSYGCVFRPSLRCNHEDNKTTSSSDHYVSKLGKKSVIETEYVMMTKLKNILDSIPNYDKYFGLDVSKPCQPKPLSHEDLDQFDKKCNFNDIGEKTVNNKEMLSSLSFVNLPYGGISLLDWIYDGNIRKSNDYLDFLRKSSSLIRHGIVPMNAKGVLHNDIHARNILAKLHDNSNRLSHLSLIDWGLAVTNTGRTMRKITVQRDYPITRIFFVVKIKQPFSSYVQSTLNRNLITEYSFSNSSPNKKSDVYNLLLKMSLEFIFLSKKNEKGNVVHSCRHCDDIFKNVLKRNELYKNTYLPFLEKHIANNEDNLTNPASILYDIGITFTTFINTMYLTSVMHRYIEMKNSTLFINFRKYFTEIYRFNADVYAMCNCILSGVSKVYNQNDTVGEGKYDLLAELLLNEVFLKSTELIDYKKVCDSLDSM